MLNKLIQLIIEEDREDIFEYADNNKEALLNEIETFNNDYSPIISKFTINNVYKILDDLNCCFHSDKKDVFVGSLWALFYNTLDANNKNIMLHNLLNDDIDTWTFIHLLPIFFEKFKPENFKQFSIWLLKMSKYVSGDMANGRFYGAIHTLVSIHHKFCREVLKSYSLETINNELKSIYPVLLGYLRKMSIAEISDIDKLLENSKDKNILFIYYYSFIFSIDSQITQIKSLLFKIRNNEYLDFENTAFVIAYMIYLNNKENKKNEDYLINWFIENSTNILEPSAQYYCLSFVEQLTYTDKKIKSNTIEKILCNIGKIEQTHLGNWKAIESILVSILNKENFSNILKTIISINGKSFINNLEKLMHFSTEFTKIQNKKLYTSLLFSKNQLERNFIQKLISCENIPNLILDKEILNVTSEILFEITFLEMLIICYSGKRLGSFFCFLNSKYDNLSNQKFNEYIEYRIFYASINYQQDCYEQIFNLSNKSKLIQNVVKKVEEYKTMLEVNKYSPVNSFAFPGSLEIACINEEKKQSEIRKTAMEKSVFSSLISKPIKLLYGDKYASRTSSGLSQSGDYTRMSVSIEIPILSFINVCGETMDKIDILNRIQYLQEVINNDKS